MKTTKSLKLSSICRSTLLLLFAVVATPLYIYSQQTETSTGIDLYKKGDYASAITNLQISDDYNDLYYLGLSYEQLGKGKDAKKAYEKSFKSGYQRIETGLLNQSIPKKQLSALLNEFAGSINITLASAQRAFALKGDIIRDSEWVLKAQFLNALDKLIVSGERAYSKDELDADLKITAKPRPNYPTDRNGQGTVILWVIFPANGKVSTVAPLKAPGPNFSVEAFNAAKNIAFTPAMKNGKPVTTLRQIEYVFSIQ